MERKAVGDGKRGYSALSAEQRALIELSVAALKGSHPAELPADVDLGKLLGLAKLNYITGVIYPAARTLGDRLPPQFLEKLRDSSYKLGAYYAIQKKHTASLRTLLEENEVDFVGIKGYVLGDLYPSGTVRACADVDFYVKASDREKVRRVLMKNGFTEGHRDVNHDEFTKGGISFEAHHELFFESPELNAYFRGLFKRMKLKEGSRAEYVMGNEDILILHTAHAKRHFLTGGTGLRTVLDHRIARTGFPTDEKHLSSTLESLGLWKFFSVLEEICNALFEDGELSDDATSVLEHMINGGIFGDLETEVAMRRSNGGTMSRLGYVRKRAFPSYGEMKKKYELLEKAPILLPFCYIHRAIYAFTLRRAITKRELSAIGKASKEELDRLRKLRETVE